MRRITIAGVKRRSGRLSLELARRLGAIPVKEVADPHAASLRRWLAERSFKLKHDHPSPWSSVERPQAPYPSLVVLIHAHFPELVSALVDRLRVIPVPFDLIITNSSGEELAFSVDSLPQLRELVVLDVPNHGRDILPLISVVNAGLLDPYELVLKMHTKKSAWRESHTELAGDGQTWRENFLASLLGSEPEVKRILSRLAGNPAVGMVTAPGSVVGPEFWGGDKQIVHDLLRRLQFGFDEDTLSFASGSMYWCRAFLLQGLRGLDLRPSDFEAEGGQVDGTTAHGIERLLGVVTREAGYTIVETDSDTDDVDRDAWIRYSGPLPRPRAQVIPFYLPQFHTFSENEAWWGHGFTEWSNVTAARPLFDGHNQPLLPGELGFYDLSSSTVRSEQYDLALDHGLAGFMYYYYWFAGKTLMSGPVEALTAEAEAHPFCIMWANENWSRRWDGSERDILIAQDYEQVPATRFIHDVMHLLTDPRYMTVDGKPVLAIYRITQIPEFESVLQYWRDAALEAGLPGLHLVTVDVGRGMDGVEGDLTAHGIDAYLEFAPHNKQWSSVWRPPLNVHKGFEGNLLSYSSMVEHAEDVVGESVPDNRYPGVMVNFDNTARRQWQPDVWYGSNPYTFRRWLNSTVDSLMDRDRDRRVVFVNAWNEWAESAVLEPSQRWGRTYLLAARDVLVR